MAADSFIEQIIFETNGAQVLAAIADVTKEMEELRKRREAVNKAMADPAQRAATAELLRLGQAAAQQSARLTVEARLTGRLKDLRSGNFIRGYYEELRVRRDLARVTAAEQAARLRADRQVFRRSDSVGEAKSGLRAAMALAAFDREKRQAEVAARQQVLKSGEFGADARGALRDKLAGEAVGREEEAERLRARLGVSAGQELAMARDRLEVDKLRQQVAEKIAAAEAAVRPAGLAAARERLRAERDRERAARETAAHDRRARLEDRFGARWGSRLADAAGVMGRPGVGMAAGGVGMAGGFLLGQARAGYAGTVQEARLAAATTRFQRALGSTLVPITDRATDAIDRMATMLDKLSGPQQNAVAGFIGLSTVVGSIFAGRVANVVSHRAFGAGLTTIAGEAVGGGVGSYIGQKAAQRTGTNVAEGAAGGAAANLATRGGLAASAARFGPYAAVAIGAYLTHEEAQRRGGGASGYLASVGENIRTGGLTHLGMDPGRYLARQVGGEKGVEGFDARLKSLGMEPSSASEASRLMPVGSGFRDIGSGLDAITAAADREAIGPKLDELIREMKEMNGKTPKGQEGPREKRG